LKTEAEAPAVKKHLDRIGTEVQRANKTIHDLLDLARNRPPQRRPTPMRELVDGAAEASLLPAALTVHVSAPSHLTFNIDPDQVRQVLINLFINASQAMKGRGQIWVEAEAAAGGGGRLRIRDDGPGIPADVRARAFEALFTTKAKGSGLGLALCRRIMEAHAGTIEIESGGEGASFLLVFPAGEPT
jgi:signal transduction histidine kinase